MTTRRICPPPSEAVDPGFLQAMRTDEVASLVQAHLTHDATLLELVPDYVRWKDRDGSLVGHRATVQFGSEVVQTYVTARTAAPMRLASEAERLRHREEEDHGGLRAFAFLPERDLLLLAFPLDRAMHDLRRLCRASKLRSLVAAVCPTIVPDGLRFSKSRSQFTLVRYKPERRAVLHWQVGIVDSGKVTTSRPSIWIRCHAEAQAARTQAATEAAAAAGIRCPRTIGIAHERLAIESHVDGRTWSPLQASNGDDFAAAARVVARLHATPPPSTLPQHHALAELDLVLIAAEDLGRLDPRLGGLARSLADRLSHDVPKATPLVFAHGDLHPGQVLLDADSAALVDFDRACAAPVAHDLATLVAQCASLDPQRGARIGRDFVAAYAAHGELPSRPDLAWWTGCAMVRNATTPFRRLQPDWRARSAALLGLAERVLERATMEGAWS